MVGTSITSAPSSRKGFASPPDCFSARVVRMRRPVSGLLFVAEEFTLCRPSGALLLFFAYPALTRWANFLTGLRPCFSLLAPAFRPALTHFAPLDFARGRLYGAGSSHRSVLNFVLRRWIITRKRSNGSALNVIDVFNVETSMLRLYSY